MPVPKCHLAVTLGVALITSEGKYLKRGRESITAQFGPFLFSYVAPPSNRMCFSQQELHYFLCWYLW